MTKHPNPVLERIALAALTKLRVHVPLQYGITVVVHGGGGPDDFQMMSSLKSHTELDAFIRALAAAAAANPAGGEL